MLTVIDEYTREVLCVAAKLRMGHAEVLDTLYPLYPNTESRNVAVPTMDRNSSPAICKFG